jgi:hypothetical protein
MGLLSDSPNPPAKALMIAWRSQPMGYLDIFSPIADYTLCMESLM